MRNKSLSNKKERNVQQVKNRLVRVALWFLGLFISIFLGYLAVRYFGTETVIIDQSMNPTLMNEDVVLVNRFIYKVTSPKRMDIVAIKIGTSDNSPTYVRRIVGLPGETINISDGKLYIDNIEVALPFNTEAIADAGVAAEADGIKLKDDEFFVLCEDYNNNRDDSRLDSIGTIDSKQIIGEAWFIWSPFDRFGKLQ